MKILLVTQLFPPDTGGGGIAAYALASATGLLRRGHEVRVISRSGATVEESQTVDGIPVYRVPQLFHSYRWSQIPVAGRYARLANDIFYALKIRRKVGELATHWSPDLIEYADIDAEGLLHSHGSPRVVRLHASHRSLRPLFTQREMRYATAGIEMLERFAIRRASALSSPTRWFADEVSREETVPRSAIQVIPNSLDTSFYSPGAVQGLPSPMVLYVGRLQPSKGVKVFAESIEHIAREFSDMSFVFVGADRPSADGRSQEAELKNYFSQRQLLKHVRFVGHSTPDVLREFYRSASVFVMPSLFESFGYTVLEAMACGTPVVASDLGSIAEIVDHDRTGILFPRGNPDALGAAVVDLLRSPEKRQSLGEAGRRKVCACFSIDTVALSTEQFYANVINSWRTSPNE